MKFFFRFFLANANNKRNDNNNNNKWPQPVCVFISWFDEFGPGELIFD